MTPNTCPFEPFRLRNCALVVQSATRDWGNGESALLGVACIPAAIGIAFIVLGFFNPNKA